MTQHLEEQARGAAAARRCSSRPSTTRPQLHARAARALRLARRRRRASAGSSASGMPCRARARSPRGRDRSGRPAHHEWTIAVVARTSRPRSSRTLRPGRASRIYDYVLTYDRERATAVVGDAARIGHTPPRPDPGAAGRAACRRRGGGTPQARVIARPCCTVDVVHSADPGRARTLPPVIVWGSGGLGPAQPEEKRQMARRSRRSAWSARGSWVTASPRWRPRPATRSCCARSTTRRSTRASAKIEKQLARAVEKGKATQEDADAVRGRIKARPTTTTSPTATS